MLQRLTRGRLPEVPGVQPPLTEAAWASAKLAAAQGTAAVALVLAVHGAISTRHLGSGVLLAAGVAVTARAVAALLASGPEAVAERYATALRLELLRRTSATPGASRGSGASVAAATSGVDAVARVLSEVLPATLVAMSSAAVATVILLVLDPSSAIIAWLPLLPMPLVAARVSRRNAPALGMAWRRVASLSSRFTEVVRVLPTLRATGGLERAVEELDAASSAFEESTGEAMRRALAANLALDFLAGLSIGLVAMGLGFRLMGGHADLAMAVAVLVAVPELTGPARRLGASAHTSREATVAAERLTAEAAGAPPRAKPGPGPIAGSTVELNAASYRAGDLLLGPIDLVVPAGGAVVLRGPSGAGKSTLLGLLAGAVPLASGRGEVDGHGLGAPGTVLVPASPSILSASLAQNVDLGRGVAEAKLREAIELVGLGPLLARLPAGLGTMLGVGGRPLSAGEAQRIGLARAVVAEPSLLLLDEPTAHLDRAATEELAARLKGWLAQRSVVVAAHGPTLLDGETPTLLLGSEVPR